MRILHVVTTLDVGGAEMHLLTQVRGQSARGHEVRVAYLKGHGTLVPDFLEAGAREVRRVGLAPWRLAPLVRGADLVHSHLLKADALTAVTASLLGRRATLVSGKHNDEQALRRPLVSRLHGILGNLPVRTVVLSDHVGRFVAEFGRVRPERMSRVYYGIDPGPWEAAAAAPETQRAAARAEFGFGPQDVVFVCVARFAAQKAHDVLLRAFAAARRDPSVGDRLRLLLVGDDPFGDGRTRAEALAQELQLGSGCVFAGIRRDVPRLVAASDVFTMSSLWEGLGLVFLEAMAAGKPVLSTHVSAIPEVVLDGMTGRLVPPGEVQPLADGMLELARDPALRSKWGAAGRERVREVFGLDRMVDETLAIYREVCTAAGRC